MEINSLEHMKALKALKRVTKQHERIPTPEPRKVPKYVYKQYNGKHRATIRLKGKVSRVGLYDSEEEAVEGQKQYCIKHGTTYEEVMSTKYDIRSRKKS